MKGCRAIKKHNSDLFSFPHFHSTTKSGRPWKSTPSTVSWFVVLCWSVFCERERKTFKTLTHPPPHPSGVFSIEYPRPAEPTVIIAQADLAEGQ